MREQRSHDCASLDWPTGPHPTPSGSGLAPTADRSKTPAEDHAHGDPQHRARKQPHQLPCYYGILRAPPSTALRTMQVCGKGQFYMCHADLCNYCRRE